MKTYKFILIIVLLTQSACMSISGMTEEHDSKMYIGTKTDMKAIPYLFTDEPAWGILGVADLPFSFVIDTVCLPYTVPHDLLNWTDGEEKYGN